MGVDWNALRTDYESGQFSQSALERKHGVSRKAIWKHATKEQWVTSAVTGHRSQVTDTSLSPLEIRPHDTSLTPKKTLLPKKDKQQAFLTAFAEHGNVLLSARAAGVSRQAVYLWLEHDEDFTFAYHHAKEDAKDVLRAEIYRRAHDGWDEDVYQLAKYAGTVHKYSDTLLIFHAKALMSEYREKSTTTVQQSGSLTLAGQVGFYPVQLPAKDEMEGR